MTLFRPSLLPSPLLNQLRSNPTIVVALPSLPSPDNPFPTQRRAGSSRSKSSAFTTPGPILLSQPPGFVPQLGRLAVQRAEQKAYKETLRERDRIVVSLTVDLCEGRLEGGVEGIVRELKKKAKFRSQDPQRPIPIDIPTIRQVLQSAFTRPFSSSSSSSSSSQPLLLSTFRTYLLEYKRRRPQVGGKPAEEVLAAELKEDEEASDASICLQLQYLSDAEFALLGGSPNLDSHAAFLQEAVENYAKLKLGK